MECDIIFFTFQYSLFTFFSYICAVKGIQAGRKAADRGG